VATFVWSSSDPFLHAAFRQMDPTLDAGADFSIEYAAALESDDDSPEQPRRPG